MSKAREPTIGDTAESPSSSSGNAGQSSDKIRLGFFIQHFPPYLGGAERQSRLLAEELGRRGHEVRVITTRYSSGLPSLSSEGNVTICRLPTVSARWLKLPVNLTMGFYGGLANARHLDIFHAHCLSPFVLGALLAAKLYRRPILVKICSVGGEGDIERIRGFGPGSLLWRLFRRADLFVSPTSTAVSEIEGNKVDIERITVIPSQFEESVYPTDHQERLHLRQELNLPNKVTLIYVGRLEKGKGIAFLMETWPALARKYPVQLVVVGDGPLAEALKSWREQLENPEAVTLAGYQVDPTPWYRASDIFVFPSHSESFGNVIVEAMSHGLAVATTRVGVVNDWTDDAPLCVIDTGQQRTSSTILGSLIEDEHFRTQLGNSASDFVRGLYGIGSVTNQYQRTYRQLIQQD